MRRRHATRRPSLHQHVMQQGPQLDATPVLHSVNQYKAIFALVKVLAEAFLIRVLRRYEILFFFGVDV